MLAAAADQASLLIRLSGTPWEQPSVASCGRARKADLSQLGLVISFGIELEFRNRTRMKCGSQEWNYSPADSESPFYWPDQNQERHLE